MRYVLICLGLLLSVMGLSACGGGGDSATVSDGGGSDGSGGTVTSSSITLPTSVQVVSSN
jgi:ABC-type glycerol-3-phosphate transport system substrate-binding protein